MEFSKRSFISIDVITKAYDDFDSSAIFKDFEQRFLKTADTGRLSEHDIT